MHKRCLDGDRIFLIDEFLTLEECVSFTARSERAKYDEAT